MLDIIDQVGEAQKAIFPWINSWSPRYSGINND